MLEPNNPEIDFDALGKRLAMELDRPEHNALAAADREAQAAAGHSPARKDATWLRARVHAAPGLGKLARWAKSLAHLTRTRALVTQHAGWLVSLEERTARIAAQGGEHAARLDAVDEGLNALSHGLEDERARAAEALSRGLEDERARAEEALSRGLEDERARAEEALRAAFADLEARLVGLQAELRLLRRARAEDEPVPAAAATALRATRESDALAAFYAAFEARFRGSRESVKARLAPYLSRLRAAAPVAAGRPVADIGCGRGEWLELLAADGLAAQGVDVSAAAVAECRALGLDASEGEGTAYLRGVPAGSLGAVTIFHLIEHLPLEAVLAMLDAAWRALAPGGLIVIETPNPENLRVGALTFYNDPTHRNPIPPEVARFTVEQRGFVGVEIMRLHPNPDDHLLPVHGETDRRLNELLYGPQDYAVIGVKPDPEATAR